MAQSAFLPGLATQHTEVLDAPRHSVLVRVTMSPVTRTQGRHTAVIVVAFLVQTFAQKLGKSVTQVFEGTLRRLVEYSWPGNVRELQNVIERGVILSPSNLLVLDREFSLAGDEARAATVAETLESIISGASSLPGTSLREAERRHIESAGWRLQTGSSKAKKAPRGFWTFIRIRYAAA